MITYQTFSQLGGAGGIYENNGILVPMLGNVENDGGVISPILCLLFTRVPDAFHVWATDHAYLYLQFVDTYVAKSARVFVLP